MATLEKAVNLSDFSPSLLLPVYLPLATIQVQTEITNHNSEIRIPAATKGINMKYDL